MNLSNIPTDLEVSLPGTAASRLAWEFSDSFQSLFPAASRKLIPRTARKNPNGIFSGRRYARHVRRWRNINLWRRRALTSANCGRHPLYLVDQYTSRGRPSTCPSKSHNCRGASMDRPKIRPPFSAMRMNRAFRHLTPSRYLRVTRESARCCKNTDRLMPEECSQTRCRVVLKHGEPMWF